jgi:hypothetical protein
LKAIRLTQLQICQKKLQKIVPKLFEQTTYLMLVLDIFFSFKIKISHFDYDWISHHFLSPYGLRINELRELT